MGGPNGGLCVVSTGLRVAAPEVLNRMTEWLARGSLPALVLNALFWTACAVEGGPVAEGPSADAEDDADSIATVSLALGGSTELWRGNSGERPLHLGAEFTIFYSKTGDCEQPVVIRTVTGAPVSFTNALPDCQDIGATGSGPTTMVLYTHNASVGNRTWISTGPNAQGRYTWTQLPANVAGGFLVSIFVTSSKVYYSNLAGEVWAYDIASGTRAIIAQSETKWLLGLLDSSNVLTQSEEDDGEFQMEKQPIAGGAPNVLTTHSTPFLDLTFDTNHFYFTQADTNGKVNIMRVPRSGGQVSVYLSNATESVLNPLTNGSALWWKQGSKIRRKNLSNGNIVSATFPALSLHRMILGSSNRIYVTGQVAANPTRYGLVYTQQ